MFVWCSVSGFTEQQIIRVTIVSFLVFLERFHAAIKPILTHARFAQDAKTQREAVSNQFKKYFGSLGLCVSHSVSLASNIQDAIISHGDTEPQRPGNRASSVPLCLRVIQLRIHSFNLSVFRALRVLRGFNSSASPHSMFNVRRLFRLCRVGFIG